ncbi:hypothetical protein C7974DRAFT_425611 [Boeremia exigua]|uniref:uncharacterized protein n=1 Tax=Boeremia exigua TaxID=749465 RepID=UPI001E8E54E4|nr:uncharacterized protein C7974DRAFT_425611 [Boeremia exigua]KAH6621848.1 hypothetical protein C7974DRAFT_425611 [Boeremia exigua]
MSWLCDAGGGVLLLRGGSGSNLSLLITWAAFVSSTSFSSADVACMGVVGHAHGQIYWGSDIPYCGSCGYQKNNDYWHWKNVRDWDIVQSGEDDERGQQFPVFYDQGSLIGQIQVYKKGARANTYSVISSGSGWFNHAGGRMKILVDCSWPNLNDDDQKKLWRRVVEFTDPEGLRQALEIGYSAPNRITSCLNPSRKQQKQTPTPRVTSPNTLQQRKRFSAPSTSKQLEHNASTTIFPSALVHEPQSKKAKKKTTEDMMERVKKAEQKAEEEGADNSEVNEDEAESPDIMVEEDMDDVTSDGGGITWDSIARLNSYSSPW